MLFPYQYVPHKMERMQEFIDFIFYEVWCRAATSGQFSLNLFNTNVELKEVMNDFYYGHTKGGDFFYSHVERIYDLFAVLPPAQIEQFKRWFQANNNIEKICSNDPDMPIARYADIAAEHDELSNNFSAFYKGLYDYELLGLSALKKKIGKIHDHYNSFMKVNTAGKCPFCGINDIKGEYHEKREAYDHYLPKKLYPFNTINFRNLAPACHECNSSYKLTKDPVSTALGRRKAFYPYANPSHTIDIKIDLKKPDVDHLTPDDIELECGPAELNEEIETWKDVYGIEERYKAKCCSEADGKFWLTQVLDEWQVDGRSPADFLRTITRQEAINPYADNNFLKKAFLEGCNRAGMFNAHADGG